VTLMATTNKANDAADVAGQQQQQQRRQQQIDQFINDENV